MKRTFIPPSHRPHVIGTEMKRKSCEPSFAIDQPLQKKVVCICMEEDSQTAETIKKQTQEEFALFFLDELGISWHFSFFKGEITFYTKENRIQPLGIYHRLCFPKGENFDKNLIIALSEAVHNCTCPQIGAHYDNFYNQSKIFQLHETIHPALKESQAWNVSTPVSHFIKGDVSFLQQIKNEKKQMIVKSCSSTRSKVVDQSVFLKWTKRNIHTIPTLFQEKIEGEDVRIHVLGGHVWGVRVRNKDKIDYRYCKNELEFETFPVSAEISRFCQQVIQREKLFLGGIDFVSNPKGVVCLECNPGPGWSWYKAPDFIKSISNQLLTHLK